MFRFFSKSLVRRLVTLSFLTAIIPVAIVAAISFYYSEKALKEASFNQLSSINQIKKDQIINYLKAKEGDLSILSKSSDVHKAFEHLLTYHDAGGGDPNGPYDVSTTEYKDIYEKVDPFFKQYLASGGYYDIFFICKTHGHVMYTSAREDDLGTNLKVGPYRDSVLAKLWSEALKKKRMVMADYSHYAPSNDAAAFMGKPVFDKDGKIYAVIALQISTEEIDAIAQEKAGMGKTGETYFVGGDLLMRSDSRFSTESTILKRKVDTAAVRRALGGKKGSDLIEDYRGVEVLSCYAPLDLKEKLKTDFDWVIVSEIDEAEAFAPVRELGWRILWIAFIIIIAACIFGYLFARSISGPLTEGANTISASISELSATAGQLAATSAETSSSVSEVTATVEEVKQTSELSNEKAGFVADKAEQTLMVSEAGKDASIKTGEGISAIKEEMTYIADSIMKLSEQTQSIGEIINSVNDIADQSNLLSVNASIEAAKAGEYGKGFAVVAQEVKSLADQSKESTDQVRTILNDIQKATGNAVMATERGTKAVEKGVDLVAQSGDSIQSLADGIEESAQSTTQIAASSQQQLVGMDQLAQAMESIKEASMQNVDGAKQLEEAIKGLEDLGRNLKAIVGQSKG